MSESKKPGARKHRIEVDNVIYANFRSKRKVTVTPKRHESTAQEAHLAYNITAQRFLELALKNADRGRISRGINYYRTGHVLNMRVYEGRIVCEVAGSQNEPFEVTITFPFRKETKLRDTYQYIASVTNGVVLVNEGKLDACMLDNLVGAIDESVYCDCTCPDRSLVCKHGVAAAYLIAERISSQPGLILEVRGTSMLKLEQIIARYHAVEREEEEDNESFWEGKALPELPDPKVAPAIEDSDTGLLHEAMRLLSYTTIDGLRAVSDIEDMYEFLSNGEHET